MCVRPVRHFFPGELCQATFHKEATNDLSTPQFSYWLLLVSSWTMCVLHLDVHFTVFVIFSETYLSTPLDPISSTVYPDTPKKRIPDGMSTPPKRGGHLTLVGMTQMAGRIFSTLLQLRTPTCWYKHIINPLLGWSKNYHPTPISPTQLGNIRLGSLCNLEKGRTTQKSSHVLPLYFHLFCFPTISCHQNNQNPGSMISHIFLHSKLRIRKIQNCASPKRPIHGKPLGQSNFHWTSHGIKASNGFGQHGHGPWNGSRGYELTFQGITRR